MLSTLGNSRMTAAAFANIGEKFHLYRPSGLGVISPFLTGCIRRTYAAIFSFIAGVMPPMPMFGRSLLYVQSHCVA